MKPNKCLYCGGNRFKPFEAYSGYEVESHIEGYVCVDCGFIMQFTNDLKKQQEYYDKELQRENDIDALCQEKKKVEATLSDLESKINVLNVEIEAIRKMPKNDDITLKELKDRRDAIKEKKKEIENINKSKDPYIAQIYKLEREINNIKQGQSFVIN